MTNQCKEFIFVLCRLNVKLKINITTKNWCVLIMVDPLTFLTHHLIPFHSLIKGLWEYATFFLGVNGLFDPPFWLLTQTIDRSQSGLLRALSSGIGYGAVGETIYLQFVT